MRKSCPASAPSPRKFSVTHDADRRFLAGLGYYGEPDLAFLNIKDRIRRVALREYRLLFREQRELVLPAPIVARKVLGSNVRAFFLSSNSDHVCESVLPRLDDQRRIWLRSRRVSGCLRRNLLYRCFSPTGEVLASLSGTSGEHPVDNVMVRRRRANARYESLDFAIDF